MTTVQDTYLGWEQPEHLPTCERAQWLVDFRTGEGEFRERFSGDAHKCPNDVCGHGDWYERTTVRIVCPSCQVAFVFRGEGDINSGTLANTTHGYGLPPRRVAGLLLWPGEPFLNFGRMSSDEPYDFLVTRPGVQRVTRADVVGAIMQTRGRRGGITWTAAVEPRDSKYSPGQIDWARDSGDTALRSVTAAAKWIGAQLPPTASGGECR
ncbi:hypothetical protein SSP24_06440 [Streptomyces spinoverrucosus]|uniref:Uncharacterized protein n=1 Tax=Streptomyces spinoverrucosus TaxID=284043 RepID=A0A4Y3VBC9_9ACTN|nr:hypothetical protein [Streptomyces spinoverrucosus]GEC02989.1 hypothetical protein SSP24_06440 [Streptomyces spinoverrucosus]GHB39045.1 hypothetical protein GCM10010397_06150 [Streptomyces spinoverrucosus]